MEKTKHTPGPWKTKDGQEVMAESGKRLIAQCHAGHREERGANARLIAAAPDLLEACKRAVELIESNHPITARGLLRLAISRAEGKE